MSNWIKCEDEMPSSEIGQVIVYIEEGSYRYYTIGKHNGEQDEYNFWTNQSGDIIDEKVTAWMPIPEYVEMQERFDEMWDEMERKEGGT